MIKHKYQEQSKTVRINLLILPIQKVRSQEHNNDIDLH
jgi:hypothetical protein